jgi:hypothetical protein
MKPRMLEAIFEARLVSIEDFESASKMVSIGLGNLSYVI